MHFYLLRHMQLPFPYNKKMIRLMTNSKHDTLLEPHMIVVKQIDYRQLSLKIHGPISNYSQRCVIRQCFK